MQRGILAKAAIAVVIAGAFAAAPAAAGTIVWTDWTSASSTTASGTMGGVAVDYTGELAFVQTSGGINYWVPDAPYLSATVGNAPPDSDIVAITGGEGTNHTVTFDSPVTNPIFAIVSLGQGGLPVEYHFDAPFNVLSSGNGYWGGGPFTGLAGNILHGEEGHGAIQFEGTFTSISWTTPQYEYWHGFTVGQEAPVPEPATLALLGGGIVALARRRRGRQSR